MVEWAGVCWGSGANSHRVFPIGLSRRTQRRKVGGGGSGSGGVGGGVGGVYCHND